jgi:GDP/GTP exchange factor required for growth at low temperature
VEELISAKSSSSTSPRAHNAQTSGQSHAARPRRPSRMSVHTLLHPSMFKHGGGKSGSGGAGGGGSVHEHPPPAVTHPSAPGSGRKLRRTRSIPDNLPSGAHDLSPSSSSSRQQHPGGHQAISRGHSQSVTAADLPTLPIMKAPIEWTPNQTAADIFCGVMQWSLPPTPESASSFPHASLVPTENPRERNNSVHSRAPVLGQRVSCPFGPGVSFDSPLLNSPRRESILSTPTPPLLDHHLPLRSMHSSDSVMTARQLNLSDDKPVLPTPPSFRQLDIVLDIGPLSLPPFLCTTEETVQNDKESSPFPPDGAKGQEQKQEGEEPRFAPSPETSMHSRYSTDVFDVLQTYRGLPQLDRLASNSSETTIKMSLAADETAAPKNDPRFVIWGDVHPTQHDDDGSVSHGSHADVGGGSGHSSNASWKRKGKHATHHADVPSLRVSTMLDWSQKMLLAATIERWIAQLTSDLNYDELLTFFLTYRTYISAVDLCHLLICRFHWALLQPLSPQDEAVRRIVRVRTFVALRYWLLTFFVVDFLGNRELRLLLASWVNTLIKDPVLKKHSDGLVSMFSMFLSPYLIMPKTEHSAKIEENRARLQKGSHSNVTMGAAADRQTPSQSLTCSGRKICRGYSIVP